LCEFRLFVELQNLNNGYDSLLSQVNHNLQTSAMNVTQEQKQKSKNPENNPVTVSLVARI